MKISNNRLAALVGLSIAVNLMTTAVYIHQATRRFMEIEDRHNQLLLIKAEETRAIHESLEKVTDLLDQK